MKSYGVTIQTKATEQFFPVVLFYCLLSLWMKSYGVTIQLKATERFFHAVLFAFLHFTK